MQIGRIGHLLLAASLLTAPDLVYAARPLPPPVPTGDAVLFSRTQFHADGTARSSNLWLASPAGQSVVALTPAVEGVHDGPGNWSPDGTQVVFERGRLMRPGAVRFAILVLDLQSGRTRRLVAGAADFRSPVWGPGQLIAFLSRYRDRECVSVVASNRHRRHDLLCVAGSQLERPTWSNDGTALYVAAGRYTGGLEPLFRSQAFRIDLATGVTSLLTDQLLEEARTLEFAPDGTRGVYANAYVWEMNLVDFATDVQTPIGWGYAPRWSPDGRRIAYTGEIFEDGPEFRYYEPLYVMDADGSNVRRLTASRVDNHAYTAADWSADGTRILANYLTYLDPSLTVRRSDLRVVNLASGAETALPQGYAEPGAWLEP